MATAIVLDPKPTPSQPPPTLPAPESDVSSSIADPEDDLYSRLKTLQRQLEFFEIQEEYVKDELKNLRRELLRAQEEVKRIQSVPLVIGQFMEMIDQNNAIVGSTTGSNYYVRILSTINRELLKPSGSVALHRHSNALVDVLPPRPTRVFRSSANPRSLTLLTLEKVNTSFYCVDSRVLVTGLSWIILYCLAIEFGVIRLSDCYFNSASIALLQALHPWLMLKVHRGRALLIEDIGGCDIQKQEIREAVELPLTHHELYQQIGIDPPRGVLLVVGSEFVQKYLGEGPRMVRDVFRLAKENAPAIIFIDEVDAIATARFDAQTGADREVQRILMELLNQMDGFDQTVNVKVIMATNRADTLDPALLRPGRLDRKIEFRCQIDVCTAKMNLSDEVDLEDYVSRPDKISAAEITAICQEAGMHAVRKNRYIILPKDFEKGYRSNVKKPDTDFEFYK
ncbi:hypothetical protein DH2020_000746 [Rehmannia glutinosa]|uniref:Uncharacterized protein n=1 Tax=Rehmannia glutinosa TaxID=99300 RepID=A0ABR0XXC2_REHGL